MCHRFTMLTHDEVDDVVRALSCGVHLGWKPDWPAAAPRRDAFPGAAVRIIAQDGAGALVPVDAVWGFSASWSKRPVFNTRIETALGPGESMWAEAIEHGRCIVAASRFFETRNRTDAGLGDAVPAMPKRGRSLYSFGMPDAEPVLLAGVRQDGCFSVVTTKPNESVGAIHDRMPLTLAWHEAWRWLGDGFASLADRSRIALDVRAESAPSSPSGVSAGQMRLF